MHRTLLLCFIHGFKGGDDTFAGFPEHLRALASHALPNITVKTITYPKFETRGDLKECVGKFKEWLQNKVIDLEVAASTPSPTIDPSVHTILIGHSMGGIVAAETLLAISSDSPIPSQKDPLPSMASQTVPGTQPPLADSEGPTFMFPYIQGILAFDTPFLGISPGVVAHGAEQHYKTVTGAYSALSDVAGVFGYGASSKDTSPQQQRDNQKLLTQGADAMSASMTNASSDAAAVPAWQRWGKYAMFAGAAGAVAAGGAAAYLKRDTITEGWSFIGSHLEFVGCLAKGEELKSRLERIVKLNKDRNIGFANLITALGKGAVGDKKPGTTVPNTGGFVEIGAVDGVAPSERTFCTVPKSERNRKFFEKAKNEKASDEMQAHMNMFTAKDNSGYFVLGERARDLIVKWVWPDGDEWYRESEPEGGTKKVMMDVDLDVDETESNPWAGDEPIPQPLGEEGESDLGPPLPKWIDEYYKSLKSPRNRKNRAAVAIAAIETERGVGGHLAPEKPRVRPPKLGVPKAELPIVKSMEQSGGEGVKTPKTPIDPRRKPPKLGKPKAMLDFMKPTEQDDEARSATPDGSQETRSLRVGQPKADSESIEREDRSATPEGARRRPPKIGRPKAETALIVSELRNTVARKRTPNNDSESAVEEKSPAPTEMSSSKEEDPGSDTVKVDKIKDREAGTSATIPELESAEADASRKASEPDNAKIETGLTASEPNTAKPEPSAKAPAIDRQPERETTGTHAATEGLPRPRPPKLGRPKAKLESQIPRKLMRRDEFAQNIMSEKAIDVDMVSDHTNPEQQPKEVGEEARVATPEGSQPKPPKDATPSIQRGRPPKLGRPKAQLQSQKPKKLASTDDQLVRNSVEGVRPYTESATPSGNSADSQFAQAELEPARRETDLKLERKSNQHKDDTAMRRARLPKLGRPTAELDMTTNSKLAGNIAV